MAELKPIIEESMITYAGAVLQSRALVDVRDGLKPSARQIFYSMLLHKLTNDKPYKKTANAVGMAMADFYIHGDSSCEGVIMRAGQPFAMRYPLIDIKGNAGTLMESGNWAAMRYTESRLSKITSNLFKDINKNVIDDWRDSYDNTKQYPSVLPSKGFYNIVNGTQGIGVGMASSIPQYNIVELNNALIYLIDNPDCDFDKIYCAPDFATGGILYNESDVKESMKNGTGFACKLRSVIEWDNKDRCFIVTEIPYGVYTNTICKELEEIINDESNPGIERFNDLTGEKPLIKIYLSKKANPDRILKYLYKNTSLQYYYSINFTMLDKGKFPKVFTWKEMLQAHIDHEKEIYRKGFEFDLNKITNRIHIIDGLLICMANINEVVKTIKESSTTAAASINLQKNYLLDEEQAKAVLDMKLSRLAHLEVEKLEKEKLTLIEESDRINLILKDETLFKNEIKEGWKEVNKLYGDERRTKIISLDEDGNNEPIEIKQISLSYTNKGKVYVNEVSSLYSQKRNSVGAKFKLDKDEYIIDSVVGDNTDIILFFTDKGNFYHLALSNFNINEVSYLSNYMNVQLEEKFINAAIVSKQSQKPYIIFITKNGIIKKSLLSDYNLKKNIGAAAIKLDINDEIVSILFTNKEKIGIATYNGQFIMINTEDINPIGRVTRGVIGIKLNPNDYVVSSKIIDNTTKELIVCSENGYIKRVNLHEFSVTGRGTKGVKISADLKLGDFLPIKDNNDIILISNSTQLRLKLNEIPLLTRVAQGNKAIRLLTNSKVIKINNC